MLGKGVLTLAADQASLKKNIPELPLLKSKYASRWKSVCGAEGLWECRSNSEACSRRGKQVYKFASLSSSRDVAEAAENEAKH